MKQLNFIFLFAFLLLSFSMSAQSTFERIMYNSFEKGKVAIDKYGDARMDNPGSISLKTFYDIGEVKKTMFQVVSANDVQTGTMDYFGRLRFIGLTPNRVCIGVLTPGEINKCLQLLTFAKNSMINSNSSEPQELTFTNEYGFKLGFFKGTKEWKILISTNFLVEEDQIQISASELDNMIAVFQDMKDTIEGLNR